MVTSWRHLKTCFSIFNFLTKLTLVTQQRSINKGEAQVTMRSSMSFFILDTHCHIVKMFQTGVGATHEMQTKKGPGLEWNPGFWNDSVQPRTHCYAKNKSHCHMFDTMYIPVYNCTMLYILCMYVYRMRERVKYSHRVGSEAGCLLCTCSSWLVLLQAEQTIEASSTHHASCTSTNSFTVVHIQ